ncbi:MAG: Integrase core domain-containing protein [Candidatus Nitrotoga sp. LAW]|nr:MAG: Integrase core domain-containing protein [Candidatus Nitrotoga sp. LAW]
MSELLMGLVVYFVHYNMERPHQSLSYKTPDHVYRTARGGGARVVDKYSEKEKTYPEIDTKNETENRGSVVPLHEEDYPLKLDALLS